MNNCPKCGNPLQAGISSCPICGTNISLGAPAPTTENQKTNITVSSVGGPVNKAPVTNTVAEPTVTPVATKEVVASPVSVQGPQNVGVSPTPVAQAPVAPAKTGEVPAQAPAPVAASQTSQVEQVADPTTLAPTIEKIEMATPVPSIPASLTTPTANLEVTSNEPTKPEVVIASPKKNNKKTILIVVLLLAVVGAGAFFFLKGSSLSGGKNNTPPANNNNLVATSVSSNGYKFKLQDGWLINEDGKNVIVVNSSETVAIKLDHSKGNITDIDKNLITSYLNQYPVYKESEVSETKISAKDAFLVNTNINELPVQIYFIGGGTNLTLGVTIVYQSNDSKTKYEAEVTELIGTISYSDDSLKAISTIDMYKDAFNIYTGVTNYNQQPNVDENTTDPNTNQNNEQNNNPENTTPPVAEQ